MAAKDGSLTFKNVDCNKTGKGKIWQRFIKKIQKQKNLCDKGITKFCLMLQKGVYPCEYVYG